MAGKWADVAESAPIIEQSWTVLTRGRLVDIYNTAMQPFSELGDRIAHVWNRHRHDPDVLPDIASAELERVDLSRSVDYRSILTWVSSTDTMPHQMNIEATFGEPPVTLYWHPHFYIEALFWSTSTTAVHGHGFSGAFQVLAGTSVQSLFEFEAAGPTRGACLIGKLRQTQALLLKPGTTQRILSGDRFIHSVFHLGYPSVTIVVRTHNRGGPRQYSYYRPGVALSYGYEETFDELTNRLLQVARLQAILHSEDLQATVARIGKTCDLAACFRLLQIVQPILYGQKRGDDAAAVIATLITTAGFKAAQLAQALTLETQLAKLWRARSEISDDELRLFLALLLTQQGRAFVVGTVAEYTKLPNVGARIAEWISQLAAKDVLNVPVDEETRALIASCLDKGTQSASLAQRIKAEPLLAPLLNGGPH